MSDLSVFGAAPSVLCQSLLQAGIRVLIQSSLLLLVGLTVGRVMRRSGPARQQHVYQATQSAVALCALVSLALPGYLPALCKLTLPSAISVAAPAKDSDAKPTPPAPSLSQPATRSGATPDSAVSGGLTDTSGHVVTVQVVPGPVPVANDFEGATSPFRHFLQPGAAGRISAMGRVYIAVMLVWFAISACLLGWLALCYAGIRRICLRARPVQDKDLTDQLAERCSAQGVRIPALLVSADVESVFLVGIRRPAILLPAAYADSFDAVTLSAILVHEVTHLRARDGAWTLVTRLLCALLWMQPLLWRIGRLREQASEEVCDQAVVAQGCSPRAYADCLVTLAERLSPSRWERAVGSGSIVFRSSLAQRVRKLIGGAWEQSVPVTRRFRIAVGLWNTALAVSLALAVSATPLQVADSLSSDRRLDQRVAISAEGVPIGDLLTLVAQKTGVNMSATADVADEKIVIFGPPRRLRDIMNDLAALFNTVWLPIQTQGGHLRYSLVSTPRGTQYEADLADETTHRILARLEEQVQALDESPQQLARRPADDSIRRALSTPDGRAATSVFSMLSQQQRQELIDRNFVRFPVAALTEAQKDQIEVIYHGKRLDELNDNDLVKSGAAIPNAAVSRPQMEQEEVTFRVNQTSGAGGQGADLSISMSASTALSMDVTQIHTDVGFLIPAHGDPYTGRPVPKNAPLPEAKDVDGIGGAAWPDRLRALSTQTGRPVLADYYRNKPVFVAERAAPTPASPAVTALDGFCRPAGYLWWNRGKTLLFRKRDWYTQRLYEVPDRWVSGLIERLKAQKGVLTIDDLLSLHELTTNQIAGLNGRMGIPSDRLAMSGLRELLAVVAAIPGDKTRPVYNGSIGGDVHPSQVAIMPDPADAGQRMALNDFLQAWPQKTTPAEIKPGDFGFILQADNRPEYTGNQARAGIHIYRGKGSMGFGYWIALPLVLPDDRRDRTRVEVVH